METARRVLALAATLVLLSHCEHKAAPMMVDDAAAAAPSSPPPPPPPPPGPPSLANFEGEIDLLAKSAEGDKPAQPVNMLVRNDRLRVDVAPGTDAARALGGGKAFLLVRVPDKKVDVVVESKREAIELDLNNIEHLKNLAKGASGGKPGKGEHSSEPPPKIAKTGQKETIAGYPCEDWDIVSTKDNKKKASLCMAEITVSFFHLPLTGVPAEFAPLMELVDGEHLPLRVIGYDDKTGVESGRVEVTKIDRHPLDAAMFEVPAGYNVIDAMQMIQALAGGGRVPGMPPGIPGAPPGGLPGTPGHHKHHNGG